MKKLPSLLLTTTILFSGDFFLESTIKDDLEADYVIIHNNEVVDIVNKDLAFNVANPIANARPVANAGSNRAGEVNKSIYLSGTAYDPDGTVTFYKWSIGSTVISNKANFIYTPRTAGTYTLTFHATDDMGAVGTDTMVLTVQQPCPSTYPIDNGDGTCSREVLVPSLAKYTSTPIRRYPINSCATGYDNASWTVEQISNTKYRISLYAGNMAADYRWRGTSSQIRKDVDFGTNSSVLLEYNYGRDQTDLKIDVSFDMTTGTMYLKEYSRCKDWQNPHFLYSTKSLPAYRTELETISK